MQNIQNLERKVKDLTNEKQAMQREATGVSGINESLEKALVSARIEVADLVKKSNELGAKIREVQAEKEVVFSKLQRQANIHNRAKKIDCT